MKTTIPLLVIGVLVTGWFHGGAHVPPSDTLNEARSKAGVIHGTIDVVVSTREGFALATDSRISNTVGNETTHVDDYEKLFSIGDHAACVIAGMVGSEIGAHGFEVRDAIGSQMRLLDQIAKRRGEPMTAFEIASGFEFELARVVGLVEARTISTPGTVAQVSIVTFNPDGRSEWVSIQLPVEARASDPGRVELTVGKPFYYWHPPYAGRRFDIDLLGQPAVAEAILAMTRPSSEKHTQTPIMRRYYLLKREGRLDQFTLREGTLLAKELVKATIDLAPISAGVGGPVDVATVTKSGVHWVARKDHAAALPNEHIRVQDSQISRQGLDGFECVRCDFTDAQLFYEGLDDVQIIDGKFGGDCRLALSPFAASRRPETVARLSVLVQGKCRITTQMTNYP